jgi:hypothetical protein
MHNTLHLFLMVSFVGSSDLLDTVLIESILSVDLSSVVHHISNLVGQVVQFGL